MAQRDFFPKRPGSLPQIYAYSDVNYPGMLKVGYTSKDVEERVAEQYPVKQPNGKPYKIVLIENAMRSDGTSFMDHQVHKWLEKHGKTRLEGEWFKCTVSDVQAAIIAVKNRTENEENRSETFGMRPEQERAVLQTAAYFREYPKSSNGKTPHFLWNCKMRFGKTFATYQLAKKMGWKKVLVLTFKPAVQSAWEEDLKTHVDFEGWQFVSRDSELNGDNIDNSRPVVCFGSFQDFLGKNKVGGIKAKNEWVHLTNWDCVVLDEYHYGAWRENAKDLFYDEDELKNEKESGMDDFNEDNMPITTNAYLYLSGTPFRAINSGEFIEEQIYNWTYSDEQQAKQEWYDNPNLDDNKNPYASLPRMVLMTYQMPDRLVRVAKEGEFDSFDLNEFFAAEGTGSKAKFRHEDEVQKWLDLIRGAYKENIVSDLKLKTERPPMPFSHAPLLRVLNHTFWFLPCVASCYAMKNLLAQRQNIFYHDFTVVVAAGTEAGIGVSALPPVLKAMGDPLESQTITLSCGKLTTGVSVRPWTGIFMLRNSSSPETYFQAAFRVQTPWAVINEHRKTEILKQECYVFDFAPDRALRQVADYACRLNVDDDQPEKKVEEFINFLPVLAYDGSHMKQIDAAGILEIAMSGTSATLLARRWESALLVNVDNNTLQRLLDNPEAMHALMSIEGFRNLNKDIETIINKSESVKNKKEKASEKDLTAKEKKQLSEEEKELKSKRKMIQEKLIKFATRIPVFMYLTDYREQCLKDVIQQLEPGLFQKVTGLSLKDFELLVSLNVFNGALMNDAIYKFKRYEDKSLSYLDLDNSWKDEGVGLWDTVISKEEFDGDRTFVNEEY